MFKEPKAKFQGDYTIIENEEQLELAFKKLRDMFNANGRLELKANTKKNRTLTQNGAIHLYLKHLSQALNDKGYTVQKVFAPKFFLEMEWSPALCKELLWRPVQEALTGEKSSTKINRVEPSAIYDALNSKFITWDIFVSFPSVESLGPTDYEYENTKV